MLWLGVLLAVLVVIVATKFLLTKLPASGATPEHASWPRWTARFAHPELEEHYREVTGRAKTEAEAISLFTHRLSEQFPDEAEHQLQWIKRL